MSAQRRYLIEGGGLIKELAGLHGLFVFNGSHPCINAFVFEFLDYFPMNFEVDGFPALWVGWVVDPFVGGYDLPVVGLEDRIFEEEAECGHLGDYHLPGAIHLISKVGVGVCCWRDGQTLSYLVDHVGWGSRSYQEYEGCHHLALSKGVKGYSSQRVSVTFRAMKMRWNCTHDLRG